MNTNKIKKQREKIQQDLYDRLCKAENITDKLREYVYVFDKLDDLLIEAIYQLGSKKLPWDRFTSEELSMLRINAQVCIKCGKTVGENKSKYCGDGSDKDNPHLWANPIESEAVTARLKKSQDAPQ